LAARTKKTAKTRSGSRRSKQKRKGRAGRDGGKNLAPNSGDQDECRPAQVEGGSDAEKLLGEGERSGAGGPGRTWVHEGGIYPNSTAKKSQRGEGAKATEHRGGSAKGFKRQRNSLPAAGEVLACEASRRERRGELIKASGLLRR